MPSGSVLKIKAAGTRLRECWAMAKHWDHHAEDRTPVGALVRLAKEYEGSVPDRKAADQLADLMARSASNPATKIRDCDLVVPVPANPPKKHYNLPEVLASRIADAIGKPYLPGALRKKHQTAEVKFLAEDERPAEIGDAFEVIGPVRGKRVLLVDDLWLSGSTLDAIAGEFKDAGAVYVVGFVATLATKGMVSQ